MKILVLQGASSTGKTTTINLVWDELVAPNGKGVSTNRKVRGNDEGNDNDFEDIVVRGNQRIAFFSLGDYSTQLAEAIYKADSEGCDILVCAQSTDKRMQTANNALENFSVERVDKTVTSDPNEELAVNKKDASKLYAKI